MGEALTMKGLVKGPVKDPVKGLPEGLVEGLDVPGGGPSGLPSGPKAPGPPRGGAVALLEIVNTSVLSPGPATG